MQASQRIVITPGEPAGIGPELVLRLAQMNLSYEIVAVANTQLMESVAEQLNIATKFALFEKTSELQKHVPGQLKILDVDLPNTAAAGKLDVENSQYVINTLNIAIDLVSNNFCHALTTGPVQKSIINDAGISFSGHTEFIAQQTSGIPVMLLCKEHSPSPLRVALVTTHIPLKDVSTHITAERIEQVIEILHRNLNHRFEIENPCIGVCGLNPHAGEDGHLGAEETEIISPTLERLRSNGIKLIGPLSADTAFTPQSLAQVDAVLTMFHDQGLPVIKHQGFGSIVNVTLGLPIIRTSVDHGTALDIAGKGIADVSSLFAASQLAANLARKTETEFKFACNG